MKITELPRAMPPGPPPGLCPEPVRGAYSTPKTPAAFYDTYDVMVAFSIQPISHIFFLNLDRSE